MRQRTLTPGSIIACSILAMAFTAVSCGSMPGDGTPTASSGKAGIDWPTFRAQYVANGPEGGLVVEGDMLFLNEDAVYEYWREEIAPRAGEALTVNRVTMNGATVDDLWAFPANFRLTYCVGSGFSADQMNRLLPALDAAAQAWNRTVAFGHSRVTVSGSCDNNNNSVVFDVQRVTGQPYYAVSFFPSYARVSRRLFVDDTAFNGDYDLTGIITHEFGHTMGWRHEHIWTNGTTGCTAESTANARLVTSQVDQSSIMYYPFCRNPPDTNMRISDLDYVGSVQLYGLAPALNTALQAQML